MTRAAGKNSNSAMNDSKYRYHSLNAWMGWKRDGGSMEIRGCIPERYGLR